jgi:hypothetical protein
MIPMKKVLLAASIMTLSLSGWAGPEESLEPLLNKVTLKLSAEQWVTTKTALVNVVINAAVADHAIEKVQNEVIGRLNQLASGEWHVVSLDRQQDKSGLESIQIMAQARLAQNQLANLRDKAKSISKPGETFTIDSVQFIPSEEEVRQASTLLRNTIYQQAKQEVDTLNKSFPDQKYYVHQINFLLQPMPMMENMMMAKVAASAPQPLNVGNKQELQATVVLAAMPDAVTQKLVH